MAGESMIGRLRRDFGFLKGHGAIAVLLFGSYAKKERGPRDIDVCVVAPGKESGKIMADVYRRIDPGSKKYDIYTFEEMPLYLKWEVIHNHKVVWAKDEGELYEYFYYFRKLYEDQKHRMQISREEILRMLRKSPSA